MMADVENSVIRAICMSVFSLLTQMSANRNRRMSPGTIAMRQAGCGAGDAEHGWLADRCRVLVGTAVQCG
jgi:hypothetical protein